MAENKDKVYAVVHSGSRLIPAGIPGIAWNALLAAWIAFGAQTLLKIAVFVLQPIYAEEFGLSAFVVLLFPMLFTFLQAPLSPTLSHRTDRLGGGFSRRHMTIMVSMLYALIASLIAFKSISSTAVMFMILVIVCALLLGPGEPLVCAMAADWFPMEHRGFALGFHHTGYPWGSFLGGLALAYMLSVWGNDNWRFTFLILSLPTLVVAIWFQRTITLKNQHLLTKASADRGFHTSVADEVLPSEVQVKEEKLSMGDSIKLTLGNPTQLTMVISGFFICGSYWVLAGFLPLYIYYVGKYTAAQTAAYAVFFTLTGGLGQIVWGALSDKVGRKFAFIVIFAWYVVGAFFLKEYALVSLAALIGTQIFLGCATNAPYPIYYAVVYDVADRRIKGLGMAFMDVAFYAGALLLLLTGALIEWGGGKTSPTGYYWVIYMLMIIYAFNIFLVLFFSRETKGWFYKKDWAMVSRASSNIPEV
jgi:MFS family permease